MVEREKRRRKRRSKLRNTEEQAALSQRESSLTGSIISYSADSYFLFHAKIVTSTSLDAGKLLERKKKKKE